MSVILILLTTVLFEAPASKSDGIWPSKLRFEAKTTAEDRAMFSLVDDSGQVFQHWFSSPRGEWTAQEPKILGTEWHNVFGGADDGIIHFPVRKIMVNDGVELRNFAYDEFSEDRRLALSVGDNTVDGAPIPIVMTTFSGTDPFASGLRRFYSHGLDRKIENGRVSLDFSRIPEAQFYNEVPVWGQPCGFRLTVEAPAEAAGLEFELRLTSVAFTRLAASPVQRLRTAREGETVIRQTFEIPAPFSKGWTDALRADRRPRSKRPGPCPTISKLISRRGSAPAKAFEIRLVSLESLSRPGVNRPPLMASVGQTDEPPDEIKVGFLNLDARPRENCAVRVSAEDWSGRRLATVETALPRKDPGKRAFVRVNLGRLPADLAFVSFRCELLQDGRLDCSVQPAEVCWTRPIADTGSAEKRPDLPWGMGVYLHRNTDPYGYHSSYVSDADDAALARMEERAALAQKAGVKWDRVELQAFRVVPKRGVYDFSFYDKLFDVADRHGLSCVVNLGTYMPLGLDRRSEEGQRLYEEMARRMVARYKGRVRHWEVWNEPEYASFWNGTRQEFVRFSNRLHDAIKAEDPTAEVIACVTAHVDLDFIDRCKADGIRYDSFSVHPYRDVPTAEGLLADLSAVTNRSSGAKTWATEIGWSTSGGFLGGAATEREQASRLARAYLAAAGSGCVNAVFGYCFLDNGFNKAEMENNFGVVRRDGGLKPAYRALANVFRTFTDGVPTLEVKRLRKDTAICVFRMGGRSAIWSDRESQVWLRMTTDGRSTVRNLMGEFLTVGHDFKTHLGALDVLIMDRDVRSVDVMDKEELNGD